MINSPAIGGHPGLIVSRTPGGVLKRCYKVDHEWDQINLSGLRNEARMLKKLSGTGFAPELKEEEFGQEGSEYILIEDLGDSEPVTDSAVFGRNAFLFLMALEEHDIRHGDLTSPNVIIKSNKPMAIDFAESTFLSEARCSKRPESDAYLLGQFVTSILQKS